MRRILNSVLVPRCWQTMATFILVQTSRTARKFLSNTTQDKHIPKMMFLTNRFIDMVWQSAQSAARSSMELAKVGRVFVPLLSPQILKNQPSFLVVCCHLLYATSAACHWPYDVHFLSKVLVVRWCLSLETWMCTVWAQMEKLFALHCWTWCRWPFPRRIWTKAKVKEKLTRNEQQVNLCSPVATLSFVLRCWKKRVMLCFFPSVGKNTAEITWCRHKDAKSDWNG